jgi:hypothetical protein
MKMIAFTPVLTAPSFELDEPQPDCVVDGTMAPPNKKASAVSWVERFMVVLQAPEAPEGFFIGARAAPKPRRWIFLLDLRFTP